MPTYTTKLSSKGQVVIPEAIRETLGLSAGDQFVVIGRDNTVVLQTVTPPQMGDFQKLLAQARAEARRSGIKKSDVKKAISKIRRRARE
jgi:AbrB family looped-hinge helix DNA binding protein